MELVTERIPVAFAGEGATTEELTWGQLDIWLAMERLGTWMPLGFVRPLPAGVTVDSLADQLRFMLNRYQSLRTRLQFGTADGLPRQVVAGSGELHLDLVDAPDQADPAQVAAEIQRRYEEAEFDFATDWPLRTAVVRHRGRPTHEVTVICHLATDATGGRIIAADLAGRDPRTGQAATPPATMQPARLAQWERTPAARRQSRTAVRYTEEVVRTMPARQFRPPADPRQPRFWQLGFSSRAAYLALQAISARTGVGTAPALVAVYAIALARVSGVNPVVTRVLVDNRFRRQLADIVAPTGQAALLLVDVADATFDEALARTRRRTISAYKYAYYDPREMLGLEERVNQQRSEPAEVVCFFNDRRRPAGRAAAGVAPSRQEVLAAGVETMLRHELKQDEPLERFFVHVNDAPDTLDLTVLTDTHYVSPLDVEAILHTMEAVAVEGAFDPAAPTRVRT